MSMISIEAASQETLDKAALRLSGVSGGMNAAMKSAMSRAAKHLKTLVSQKARERYAISAGKMQEIGSPKIAYVMGSGIQANITYRGTKIPLYKFDGASPTNPTSMPQTVPVKTSSGQWIMAHPGVSARGHVLKSTAPSTFENAFTATMSNGHTGIFERQSGTSTKLSELMGVSPAQMAGSDEYKEDVAVQAMEKFEERLEHEVSRLLGG